MASSAVMNGAISSKEHRFKVLVIGDPRVGKTSFITKYTKNTFSPNYKGTVGVDFAIKVLNIDSQVVRLLLWDIAGQENYKAMTRAYYKDAVGCIVVYDVTSRKTFDSAIKWKEDLDSKATLPDGSKLPCILVGNKSDLLKQNSGRGCEDADMTLFCEQHEFVGWYQVSCKDGQGITESSAELVNKILSLSEEKEPVQPNQDLEESIRLTNDISQNSSNQQYHNQVTPYKPKATRCACN